MLGFVPEILTIDFAIFAAVIGVILYLIVKRIEAKRLEDFEDRDN